MNNDGMQSREDIQEAANVAVTTGDATAALSIVIELLTDIRELLRTSNANVEKWGPKL